MLFNEIYSLYYKAVEKAIDSAIKGELNDKILRQIIRENAFCESELTIVPAIKEEKWQIVCADGSTPIQHTPSVPLTNLEKSWLKAISLDKRIALFGADFGLGNDVQPLFNQEDIKYFDQYTDGDEYDNPEYQHHFKTILKAINDNHHPLQIYMRNPKGCTVRMNVIPKHLEYSHKDDKFRLITGGCAYGAVINLGRIQSCEYYYGRQLNRMSALETENKCFCMELVDKRNALERVMMHFAHFEKQAEKLGDDRYKITVWYNKEDEGEIIIRILSFGPMVKVTEPTDLVERIKQRLKKQMRYL